MNLSYLSLEPDCILHVSTTHPIDNSSFLRCSKSILVTVNKHGLDASKTLEKTGARCSSMVRVGRRIDPSWGGRIELFLVPASAPRLV